MLIIRRMNTQSSEQSTSGFNQAYIGPRPDLLRLVPEGATRVLDVGCSVGTLGAFLKKRQEARVVGVELDEAMAREAAQKLDRVIVGNLDVLDIAAALEGEVFDCIICGDVLEHVQDPWAVLASLVEHLASGGVVVASLPNVRHISTLFSLIVLNRWPYRDRGIHDRTHLRFFTSRNIKELFGGAGLSIERFTRNLRVIERVHRLNVIAPIFGIPLIRGFFTFQYLLVAKKP